MKLKHSIVLATFVAAATVASAQNVPAPRHLSEQILTAGENQDNAWAVLPENIAWKRDVWRDIDIKQKANKLFDAPGGDERSLWKTMVAGVTGGKIKAYRDDKFEHEIPAAQLEPWLKLIANDGRNGRGRDNELQVTKYQVREDSVHLRSENKTEVRMLGIAAIAVQPTPSGEKLEQPVFWISYTEALRYLAEAPITTMPEFTWADIFESRSFYAKTVKEGKRE